MLWSGYGQDKQQVLARFYLFNMVTIQSDQQFNFFFQKKENNKKQMDAPISLESDMHTMHVRFQSYALHSFEPTDEYASTCLAIKGCCTPP